MSIDAIIFDCDGVLVDSEKFSCRALNFIFAQEFGIDIGSDYSPVIGKRLFDSLSYYLKKHNLPLSSISTLMKKKDKIYQNLASNNLSTFPGCIDFLQEAKNTGYSLAVASSGSFEKINFSLYEVGITNFFDVITSAEEVSKGKPEPDVFLLTAERLGFSPKKCLVIEDSVTGAIAAKSANMAILGFPGTFNKESFTQINVECLINGYSTLYNRMIPKKLS